MDLRRILPWIIALTFHTAIVIVFMDVIILPPPSSIPEIMLDPSIQSAGSDMRGSARMASTPERARSAALPHRPPRTAPPRVADQSPRGVEMTEALTEAPAQEAPVISTAEAPLAQTAAQGPPVRDSQQGARIGWEGSARRLINKRDPAFPAQLSAAGQEVECEARITVAASGVVTRVEITRSSGYIEIDASVEAALRDYLFSRANERKDAVGTIRFSFRLERQD
jgi:TonB family protein